MPTANITLLEFEDANCLSQIHHLYEYENVSTVENMIEHCRSMKSWPLNVEITVLRNRYIDNKKTYHTVHNTFQLSPDDTFEINVRWMPEEHHFDVDSTSSSSETTTNDTNSPQDEDENNTVDVDEDLLQQVYDKQQTSINVFYESLDKTTIFKTINFYNFFTQSIDRALLYCLSVPGSTSNLSFLHNCREKFKRYIRILIDMAFPQFSATKKNFVELYSSLTSWLGSTLMGSYRDAVVKILCNSYKTARYRHRKRNVIQEDNEVVKIVKSRKRKSNHCNKISQQLYSEAERELQIVAREMRENKSPEEISLLFNQSIENRYLWIQYILEHPDFEKGAAEAIIERFPRLIDNVKYLHGDYVFFMKKQKLPVCNIASKFRQLIPGILGLALSLNYITSIPVTELELEAGKILPLLIKQYIGGQAKFCNKERYIIGSHDSINMHDIIRKKDELEITAPMIAYVKHRTVIEYYIVVDQKALKLHGSFADALQSLHELQFVLNLEYDEAVAPLFIFMEYVLGFQSRESVARFRLNHDLQSFLK